MTHGYVDSELRSVIGLLPPIEFASTSLSQIRANLESASLGEVSASGAAVMLDIETVHGESGNPDTQVYVYRPAGGSSVKPAVLHIHGGGYVMGSPRMMDNSNRQLAADLDCVVCSVAYRLAPESVFPAAIDDCYAGLSWVFNNARRLGVDPKRVGLKGESAGGGLAAALALMVRDRGEFRLVCQNLMAPMLDDRTCDKPDGSPFVGEFIWTRQHNLFGWTSMLGNAPGGDDVAPYAAPSRTNNLQGLPPTFMGVGSLDLFLEEDIDYAKRLALAGVPVELQVYPGAFHGFDLIPGSAIAARARLANQNSLRKALFPG